MRSASRHVPQRRRPFLPIRLSTLSGGVMALAAAAVGAALVRFVIPNVAVSRARVSTLEVDTLIVRKLQILEPSPTKPRSRRRSTAAPTRTASGDAAR